MSLRNTQLDQVTWDFDLLGASENKSVSRLAVQRPWASEVVGVDGSLDGGMRPFQGFKLEVELDVPAADPGDVLLPVSHAVPIFIQAGNGAERFGFQVTIPQAMGSNKGRQYLWSESSAVPTETDTGAVCNASSSFGSFCYIFTANVLYRIYYDASNIVQQGFASGPGAVPVLAGGEQVYTQDTDLANVPGSGWGLTRSSGTPSTADGPRICLFAFTGRESGELGFNPIVGPPDLSAGAGFAGITLVYELTNQPEFATMVDPVSGNAIVGLEWTSGLAGAARMCSFCYQLLNADTGLKSQLSEVRTIDCSGKGLSINSSEEAVVFPALSIEVDADDWTHIRLYRSVSGNAGLHSLDSTHEIPSTGRYLFFYTLSDLVLRQQETFQGDATYEATLPNARSGIFLEGTLLYSDIPQKGGSNGNAGTVRYSNPYEMSPENIGTGNRYTLQQPTEDVIAFKKLGSNAAGFTRQGVYIFRKEGVYVSGFPMHKGFGITAKTAAAEVGPGVYYMTEEGLKFLGPDGTLEDVGAINELITGTWRSSLSAVWIAYDAAAHVLVIFNRTLKRCVLMWFKTGRVTELVDCEFDAIIEQNWQDTLGGGSTVAAKPRVLFLMLAHIDGLTDEYKLRVWTIDYLRTGDTGRFLQFTGNQRFTVSSYAGTISPINLGAAAPTKVGRCKLYVLDSATPSIIGKSCTLFTSNGNLVYPSSADYADIAGLAAGDRVAISPIIMRWIGPPLPLQAPTGEQFASNDFFRVRRLDSINVAFSDVSGDADGTTDAFWRGLVYRSTEAEPEEKVRPVDDDGENVTLIREGESKHAAAFGADGQDGVRGGIDGNTLAPGIEIMVADLDFRVLGVRCAGGIRATERTDRVSV
jgi:hypothetical protein